MFSLERLGVLFQDFDLCETGLGDVAGGFAVLVVAVALGVAGVEIDAAGDAVLVAEHAVGVVDDDDVGDVLPGLGEVGAADGVGGGDLDGVAEVLEGGAELVVDDDAGEFELVVVLVACGECEQKREC